MSNNFWIASAQTEAQLENPEHHWSCGRSTAVSPRESGPLVRPFSLANMLAIATGTGDWAAAFSQATAIVAQMTNEKKHNVSLGIAVLRTAGLLRAFVPHAKSYMLRLAGNAGGAPRLGDPGLRLNDAGDGLRSGSLSGTMCFGLHS